MSANDSAELSRRGLFRVGTGAAAATAAVAAGGTAAAQEAFDYDGWFDDVPNFDGTVDRTGQDEVTVEVGAGDNGLVFEPPAIHVDPGTTVVFEWTGQGGVHNVAEDETGDRYESELMGDSGETFRVTYETDGISKYVCAPHISVGMKGAVAVGDGDGVPEITVEDAPDTNGAEDTDDADDADDADDEEAAAGGAGPDEELLFALYGVAVVLAFVSPIAVVFLMYRQAQQQSAEPQPPQTQ
ncbi:MAG: halocyanin domain-containing protein [Natronomonas sp.]